MESGLKTRVDGAVRESPHADDHYAPLTRHQGASFEPQGGAEVTEGSFLSAACFICRFSPVMFVFLSNGATLKLN